MLTSIPLPTSSGIVNYTVLYLIIIVAVATLLAVRGAWRCTHVPRISRFFASVLLVMLGALVSDGLTLLFMGHHIFLRGL